MSNCIFYGRRWMAVEKKMVINFEPETVNPVVFMKVFNKIIYTNCAITLVYPKTQTKHEYN